VGEHRRFRFFLLVSPRPSKQKTKAAMLAALQMAASRGTPGEHEGAMDG
jgi:hypothetical protein